ncbi:hypothetical protein [Thiolapillus sp.]|uniref:hypothetical protein n=2 Tax=Thiolapillus sp. TaxID=2017437 RepID=UPI003AF7E14E
MFSLWRKARRENSAASRLLGSTSLRFALHGWQREKSMDMSDATEGAPFWQLHIAAWQQSGLTLSLPNGLEIRGIEANNLSLVRDLLGMLA